MRKIRAILMVVFCLSIIAISNAMAWTITVKNHSEGIVNVYLHWISQAEPWHQVIGPQSQGEFDTSLWCPTGVSGDITFNDGTKTILEPFPLNEIIPWCPSCSSATQDVLMKDGRWVFVDNTIEDPFEMGW
jgi:hypothetical protein